MSKPLSLSTALVTGGSRGIGAAVAERLAAAGADVAVHYWQSSEAAAATVRKCAAHGVRAVAVRADLRVREEILRMRDELEQCGMMPDILVNNAGTAHYGLLTDVTEEDFERVIGVNLRGVFQCTQAFVPHMIAQKYGRIINISSVWGTVGASCEVLYSAAKGGVNAMTRALAKELAPSGITVNAVAPGAVDTAMLDPLSEEEKLQLAAEIPAGRLARPEEIASLVGYLALPESGYITGQVISPSGGWMV